MWQKRLLGLVTAFRKYGIYKLLLACVLASLIVFDASPVWFVISILLLLVIKDPISVVLVFLVLAYFLILNEQKSMRVESSVGQPVTTVEYMYEVYSTSRTQVFVAASSFGNLLVEAPLYPKLSKGYIVSLGGGVLARVTSEFEGGFLYYLLSQDLNLFTSTNSVIVIKTNFDLIYTIKSNLDRVLKKYLYPDNVALAAGVIWGDDSELTNSAKEAMQRTGLTHLIAVSGFNVSVIILLVSKFRGRLPRHLLSFLTVVFLVAFNLFVGLENLPATRATLMGVSVVLGNLTGRPGSIWGSLSISVIVILLLAPSSITSISFQLSVAALIGILLLFPKLDYFFSFLPKLIREGVSLTMAANLSTFPITVASFGGYSIISPISNLILGPLIPLLMAQTSISLVMSGILSSLSSIVFYPVYLLTEVFFMTNELMASLDWGYTNNRLLILLIGILLVMIIVRADYLMLVGKNAK